MLCILKGPISLPIKVNPLSLSTILLSKLLLCWWFVCFVSAIFHPICWVLWIKGLANSPTMSPLHQKLNHWGFTLKAIPHVLVLYHKVPRSISAAWKLHQAEEDTQWPPFPPLHWTGKDLWKFTKAHRDKDKNQNRTFPLPLCFFKTSQIIAKGQLYSRKCFSWLIWGITQSKPVCMNLKVSPSKDSSLCLWGQEDVERLSNAGSERYLFEADN